MPNEKRASVTAGLYNEHACWTVGCRYVVGIDEVGRGTLAGPVAAGAVCLPHDRDDLLTVLEGVRDSKQMTPRQRERLAENIKQTAVSWATGSATSREIDEHGIVRATLLAMNRAMSALDVQPDYLLLDSIKWDDLTHVPYQSMVRGDSLSLSIAAASVLAKVWRDDYMRQLDDTIPHYNFGQHKGYGTVRHLAALRQHGASAEHRRTFAPVRNLSGGVAV
ncbi:MAG: ribonuclease HII [Chloroflexi bacterium]|nr:ribonuclease HII [Chloroflexota bacterium]MCC6892449.1 ribonuclease HII [Anaerolineae bacterium]